jgi:hypothetical protein
MSFYLFLATCAYIVLERFPIGVLWTLLCSFISTLYQGAASSFSLVFPATTDL